MESFFIACLLFITYSQAYGFKPDFFFKEIQEGCTSTTGCSHNAITEDALTPITTTVEGEVLNFTDEAISKIAKWNARVDIFNFSTEAAHCDAESLMECSERIAEKRGKVIDYLTQDTPNGTFARIELGRALHTLQDFYAHSNWVNLGKTTINTALPKGTLTALGREQRTCEDDHGTLTESGLTYETTGYFSVTGNGHANTPTGKCSHGGDGADDHGINKDAPTRHHHNEARGLAIEASKQFVLSIINEDGIKNNSGALRALMGHYGDMGFAVDTTGSMGDEIAGVKKSIEKIVQDTTGVSTFDNFVLVTFGDPEHGKLELKTIFKNKFIDKIGTIGVDGGGDCPEFSMGGIQETLNNVSDASQIFVYTDASPKDANLADSIIAQANKKNVSVVFILTGTCSPVHEAYIDIAEKTGGQVFLIHQNEVENLDVLIQPIVTGDRQPILIVSDVVSGSEKKIPVAVDSSISTLTISTTVDSGISLVLHRPDGTSVKDSDPDAKIVHLSSGPVFEIENPVDGEWNIKISGNGKVSVSAFGNSTIELRDVAFVEIKGRALHQGLFPIDGLPVSEGTSYFRGLLNREGVSDISYQLRDEKGSVISVISAVKGRITGRESITYWAESASLPDKPFRIYATGTDSNGKNFLRAFPTVFSKQTVLVKAKTSGLSVPGGTTAEVSFEVTNFGDKDIFNFTATSSDGTVATVDITEAELNKSEKVDVKVTLNFPLLEDDKQVEVSFVAKSSTNSNVKNTAIATLTVLSGTPTLAELHDFTATAGPNGILLEWETITELDNAGFYIWRAKIENGEYTEITRITEQLIYAQNESIGGASYSYEDSGVVPGYTYYYLLEDVDNFGKSTFHWDFIDSATAR